jgi:TatA/E family protein of Tat protein translocase
LALINDTGIIVLIVAVVLLFGASQIPKVARNIAEAGKEFRKAHAEMEDAPQLTPAVSESVTADGDRVALTLAELDTLLRNRTGPPLTRRHDRTGARQEEKEPMGD